MAEEEKKITIKNIDYSQHNIIYNIINMHNDGNAFDCDMTYSRGNFMEYLMLLTLMVIRRILKYPNPPLRWMFTHNMMMS